MRVRLDGNGIPVMSRADIEVRAERMLQYFDAECLNIAKATPIALIALRLRDNYKVTFVLNAALGESPEGYKYRGRFHIPTRTIYIDNSLREGEPRFNFTLAHEIAHFVLHRHVKLAVFGEAQEPDIRDTSRDLVLDQLQSDNPRSWLEWQANKFAASILIPRATIIGAVEAEQCKLGITRNLGKVYLDRQNRDDVDFRSILERLGFIYQVSRAGLRLRLRELNILQETAPSANLASTGPRPIQDLLLSIVSEWEQEWTKDES